MAISRSSTSSRRGGGRRARRLRPFTLPHFREYASRLVLDNGERWELEDFQERVVRDLFAGFRELWVVLPEENGKTTLMGGVALYAADYSPEPWIPIGASSAEQATILHTQAAGFVRRSGLEKRFRVYDGYRRIKSLRNGGVGIRVYAADERTADGAIPYPFAICDEGHASGLGVYRTWKGKLRKRGAQIAMISTAGEPGTEFEETRDEIRAAAQKRTKRRSYLRSESPGIVMHEFRVESLEKAGNLGAVLAANPLGQITRQDLAAKQDSPTLDYNDDWLRKTCNIPARSSRAAITDQEWDDLEADEEIPAGEMVDVGLDVAWKLDCTALVPLWMPSYERRLFGDPIILTPPRDGTMLNPHEIEDAFRQINARNPIRRVVADREKAEQLMSWLEEELGVEVVERGRGNADAAVDYERLMEAIRQQWIRHTGHRGFRRHVMNAVARNLGSDKKRFDRPVSSRGNAAEQDRRVIDALTAAGFVHTVAEALMSAEPEAEPAVAFI
jgi:phage terminase large subunit-like protein